jgi:hypothetical protein
VRHLFLTSALLELIAKCLDQRDAICVNLELFCDGEISTKDERDPIRLETGNIRLTQSNDLSEFFSEVV